MAGHTGDRGDHLSLLILVHAEIFFIDLGRHFEHVAGDIFFGFVIAGKIQVGGVVLGWSMTEITFYIEGCRPIMHDLVQFLVADVLREDLEVTLMFFGRRRLWAGSGHADDHKSQ